MMGSSVQSSKLTISRMRFACNELEDGQAVKHNSSPFVRMQMRTALRTPMTSESDKIRESRPILRDSARQAVFCGGKAREALLAHDIYVLQERA